MEGRRLIFRLMALGACTVVLALVVVLRLYDLQIINGDSYYRQSEKKITRSIEVFAPRGEILDRYGRKLVTNRVGYNIAFDTVLFPNERKNEIIAELVTLCEKLGIEYTNTLPLKCKSGYIVGDVSSETSLSRMERWLKAMEWERDANPADFFARLRAEYGVGDEYSTEKAMEIVGIRWELDLRAPRIGLNIASYIFCKDVGVDFIATVKERDLPGVNVLTETVREYSTDYAAHILGSVGPIYEAEYPALKEQGYPMDGTVGKDGAEKAFESWLRGKNGTQVEERDSSGKVTSVIYSKTPEPGGNVMLTLDIRLQEAAEKALANRINEIKALGEAGSSLGSADVAGGAVVVLDIKNFEILAAANYPTYSLATFNRDFNKLNADPLRPMTNRAFNGAYAPGSTFKMTTALAALEYNVITKRTQILDKGIYMYYAPSYTPMCEIYLTTRGTHGSVNVVDALRVSCNYFFFEVGRLTGIDRLNEYARLFGFGERTGVELGEYGGILAGKESRANRGGVWMDGDTIQAAIGQSDNLASPLQLATYVATLAGDGTRKNTHLLKSVKAPDYSSTLYDAEGEILAVLDASPENVKTVLEGMLAVSERGSASAVFANYPIRTGSKTGTAQTGVGSANGIFVAFAPYDDPQIAVAVVVEHAGKGSRIGVIARDIFDAYFRINDAMDSVTSENELLD